MGRFLETSMAAPLELLVILTSNSALALLAYLLFQCCGCHLHRSGLPKKLSKAWSWIYPVVTSLLAASLRVLGGLRIHLQKTTFSEACAAFGCEVKDLWALVGQFSKKARAEEFERQACKQRLEEAKAISRKEIEEVRALEEFARDMSTVKVPGAWSFSKQNRGEELERQVRKRRLEEAKAGLRREAALRMGEKEMRALEEFAGDMSTVIVPGAWY